MGQFTRAPHRTAEAAVRLDPVRCHVSENGVFGYPRILLRNERKCTAVGPRTSPKCGVA